MNTLNTSLNKPFEDTRLNSREISLNEIPVIDLTKLIDGSDPQSVADQIGDVCERIGFLYIKHHGVDQGLVERMAELTKQLFDLPMAQKQKMNIVHSAQTLRGYIPMYGENVDPDNTKDFKECFDYGQHDDVVEPFFGPNLMPEPWVEFKEVAEQYHDEMLKLARKLISAIALSLNLPADYFEKLQRKPITIQRLLHYPPQAGEIRQEEIGIGAHTDYGFLTILAQDANGGLQVKNREGDWISAPPIPDTFVVNIGDLVQTFTNDRYISTLHRVINTSGRERYSMPFFIDLDFNAQVSVVDTCQSEHNPPKYESYTCGQHKYKRFVDSYEHLKNLD